MKRALALFACVSVLALVLAQSISAGVLLPTKAGVTSGQTGGGGISMVVDPGGGGYGPWAGDACWPPGATTTCRQGSPGCYYYKTCYCSCYWNGNVLFCFWV